MVDKSEITKILEEMSISQLQEIAAVAEELTISRQEKVLAGVAELFIQAFKGEGFVSITPPGFEIRCMSITPAELENFMPAAMSYLLKEEVPFILKTGTTDGIWVRVLIDVGSGCLAGEQFKSIRDALDGEVSTFQFYEELSNVQNNSSN